MQIGTKLPEITFYVRVRDESIGGENPYKWETRTTSDYFSGKRTILFALPGAFTPTCSNQQLPSFENNAAEFKALGIDEIYCLSVNDSFVMNKWAEAKGLQNVQVIPDGSGDFTRLIGMLVKKENAGFGLRSWRYASVIKDGVVEGWFEEPGIADNSEVSPYGISSGESVLEWLKANG